ncbi:12992_t:CDS:2, partial [Gigaspora margarita]
SSSRQIDPRYQMASLNNLALRLVFGKLQTDKRLKEVIYFKTRNSSTELEKVLKKRECKVLIEHWTTTKTQNVPLKVVNKCKGCMLNMLKDSQSCIEEKAWNSLTSDAKYKVDPQKITKVIFESRAEDISITRLNLTKGLIKQSVVNNLNELLSSHKDARNTGITKQFKLSAHYGSPSMKKKQPHKIDVGPRDGLGLGSSKVFINTSV